MVSYAHIIHEQNEKASLIVKKKTRSNTAGLLQTKPRGRPMVKGFDPRRNLKGVPRDAVLMRQHMRTIAAELIGSDATEMTRLDALLRQLFTSRNPAHNKMALQVLDPKILAEHVQLSGANGAGIQIELTEAYSYDAAIAAIAARPDEDSDKPA